MPIDVHGRSLSLLSAAVSRKGTNRECNGDAILVDGVHRLFAVADGVGCASGADMASRVAVQGLRSSVVSEMPMLSGHDDAGPAMRRAFDVANRAVLRENQTSGRNAQSTLTAVLFLGLKFYVGHTGDTRAYLVTEEGGRLLTNDHTVVADLLRESLISAECAKNHPRRGMLSGCLGWHEEFRFDAISAETIQGQTIVLCSDGASAFLSEGDIVASRKRHGNAKAFAETLADIAICRGSQDDLSVVVIIVE